MGETAADSSFIENLLHWFSKNRSAHYFRENRTPYRVWVSEVALQQTQIAAAEPILKNFFKRFHSIDALATADEESVVQAFKGLGYYNRARNLRKAAIIIRNQYNSRLPENYHELLKLPSIGPYTAAAIASICFNEKVAAKDGNIKRVVSRLLRLNDVTGSKPFESRVDAFINNAIEQTSQPGDFNEALMELGQKLCRKQNPQCERCPVQTFCECGEPAAAILHPLKKTGPEKLNVIWRMYLISDNKNNRLLMQKSNDFYFLKNHYILPSEIEFENGKREHSLDENLLNEIRKAAGPPGGHYKAGITRHRIRVEVYKVNAGASLIKRLQQIKEIYLLSPEQAREKAASSVVQKALAVKSESLFSELF